MDILWPGFLLLLGVIPLFLLGYIWMLRRRKRSAVRFSSLSLMREIIPSPSRWRRHIPFALFLLAIASLVMALGRPVSVVSVPTDKTTIMLAIDVSYSMCSTDILPSRLNAAEASALSFIRRQGGNTNIGLVAFSGFAEVIQPPTTDPELLQSAVESLMTGRRTAVGNGILKSLDAIAEIDKSVAPSSLNSPSKVTPTPVPQGAYAPDIIVLLTDGASNAGPLPLQAAQEAADRGVRVYTIGFGTEKGSPSFPLCRTGLMGNEPFGGGPQFGGGFGGFGGGGGFGFRRGVDEETLKQIAALTGGQYYTAESADQLQNVFRSLPTYLITKHEIVEISVFFALGAAILAVLAFFLSLFWRPLP